MLWAVLKSRLQRVKKPMRFYAAHLVCSSLLHRCFPLTHTWLIICLRFYPCQDVDSGCLCGGLSNNFWRDAGLQHVPDSAREQWYQELQLQICISWFPNNHDGHWHGGQLTSSYSCVYLLQKERKQTEKVFLALHWIVGTNRPLRAAFDKSNSHISLQSGPEMGANRLFRQFVLFLWCLHDNFWIVCSVYGQRYGDRKSYGHNKPALVL